MAFKKRVATFTMTAATHSVDIGLGAAVARVHRIEVKGDDADVDTNATFALTDAEGRSLLDALALDAGTDDSTVKATNQDYSTVGVGRNLTAIEAEVVDRDGDASADTEGLYAPPIAVSPVTLDVAAGTSGDAFQVTLFVEV